jgi:hypothetical protein
MLGWVVLTAALMWAAVRGARRAASPDGAKTRRFLIGLMLLFGLSLTLRVICRVGGPGDLRMNLQDVFTGVPDFHYGWAPYALLKLLFLVFPTADTTIVVINLLLGSLAPVLLVLFVREHRDGELFPFLAGGLLAAQPLLVRFSGDMNRQTIVLTLALYSLWQLARYCRHGRSVDLVLQTIAALLCVQSRPEALLFIGVIVAYLLLSPLKQALPESPGVLRRRSLAAVLAQVPLVISALGSMLLIARRPDDRWVLGSELIDTLYIPSASNTVFLDPDFTPFVVIALAATGLLFGLIRRSRLVIWAAVCFYGVMLPASSMPTEGLEMASARYQTLALVFGVVLAAYCCSCLAALGPRVGKTAVAVLLTTALAAVGWSSIGPFERVTAPRTVDEEYQFIRNALQWVPDGSTILYQHAGGGDEDLGQWMPWFLSSMLGYRHEWRVWSLEEIDDVEMPVYYHTANCSLATEPFLLGLDEVTLPQEIVLSSQCDIAFERYRAWPIAELEIVGRSYAVEVYESDRVHVGFYRMSPPEGLAPRGR